MNGGACAGAIPPRMNGTGIGGGASRSSTLMDASDRFFAAVLLLPFLELPFLRLPIDEATDEVVEESPLPAVLLLLCFELPFLLLSSDAVEELEEDPSSSLTICR